MFLAVLTAVLLPSRFESGRVFATPVTQSGIRLKLWIDSDGSGFLTRRAVRLLTLKTTTAALKPTATRLGDRPILTAALPAFKASAWIPRQLAFGGQLPVIAPPADDPILAGLDGQLGASWLQNRVWLFDYPAKRLELLTAAPQHKDGAEVSLRFQHDRAGRKIDGRQYPSIKLIIAGHSLRMALDTAATVALQPRVAARLRDDLGAVRATSFVRRSLAATWHADHPQWRYIRQAGKDKRIDLILVPRIDVGRVRFVNVWFSTRPDDDVFAGDSVDGKLGPTAFGTRRVVLDYLGERAIFLGPTGRMSFTHVGPYARRWKSLAHGQSNIQASPQTRG